MFSGERSVGFSSTVNFLHISFRIVRLRWSAMTIEYGVLVAEALL